jgi:hypothetical protein
MVMGVISSERRGDVGDVCVKRREGEGNDVMCAG